jgi:hypothetical protein
MNLYFESAKCLDKLDAKRGSVKSVLTLLPPANRKRGTALLIETLKCMDLNTFFFIRILMQSIRQSCFNDNY